MAADQVSAEIPCSGKPRLTLRIGVIGHRSSASGVQTENDYIARLQDVFGSISSALTEFSKEYAISDYFEKTQTAQIRIVTGIASGTDRWAQSATISMKQRSPMEADKWRLELISPAPIGVAAAWAYADVGSLNCEDYVADWQNMIARADNVTALEARWRSLPAVSSTQVNLLNLPDSFACQSLFETYTDPPVGANNLSYAHAADFQLRQCDMIIAVWDGLGSRGPGGTADMAVKAKQLGMPVIWINWNDPSQPAHLIERIDTDEAIPPIDGWIERAGRPIAETPELEARLNDVLGRIMLPNRSNLADNIGHGDAHLGGKVDARAFFEEPERIYQPPGSYERTLTLFSQGFGAWLKEIISRIAKPRATWMSRIKVWERPLANDHHLARKEWGEFVSGNPDEGRQGDYLQRTLWQRFARADSLAVDYAARFRSVFIRSYLLSACAVLIALLGLVLGDALLPEAKALLVFGELAVLIAIYLMVRDGQKQDYHAKLVEYRALAEGLRHQAWLATFGEFALPANSRAKEGWVNWYLRATSREIGPPAGTLDASFQSSLIEAILKFEINPQIAYHQRNSHKMHSVNHGLHTTGDRLFGITGIILAIFLVLYLVKIMHLSHVFGANFEPVLKSFLDRIKPWVGFFAAFLPTLGSALAGIRFTGDFEGKAAQSELMAASLEEFRVRAERLKLRCDWSSTRNFLLDLEALLSEDVAQFHSNYGRQPLALPA